MNWIAGTDADPVALQHFELVPEPVPAEVLGAELGEFSFDVWALRLIGAPVREALTDQPMNLNTCEFVFAVPLDVIGKLARELTELYERQQAS
jgi:hypothetical protein